MGNNKVDIKKLYNDPRLINAIREWDIIEFLNSHDVDYSLDGKNIGTNFIGVRPCPQCSDSRNHFAINKTKKYGTCFKCKTYMGPLKIISHYRHLSILDAFNYLITYSYIDDDLIPLDKKIKNILFSTEPRSESNPIYNRDKLPDQFYKITPLFLDKNELLRNFLHSRKIYYFHLNYYKLYFKYPDLLWGIFIENHIVAYQKRNITYKRYFNSPNLDKYLYNQENILPNKPLILVEGFFDFTRLNTYLQLNAHYQNKISITTGLLKSISRTQINKLINLNPSKLIVIFDNDSWFDYFRLKKEIPFDVDFHILPKGKDPNDLSWNEMHQLFKEIIS